MGKQFPLIEVGGESLTVPECRALIAVLVDAAEGLERDRAGTVVIRDGDRTLFGGIALTAQECREFAESLRATADSADPGDRATLRAPEGNTPK